MGEKVSGNYFVLTGNPFVDGRIEDTQKGNK